jgi:nicotinamidase-related amidase
MKPALLIVDIQKAFFKADQHTAQSLGQSVVYINSAIGMFREYGHPVIFIQQLTPEEGLAPGHPGFEIPEKINALPADIRIIKRQGNSFHQTDLAEKLGKLGIDTVFIAGYCAERCVLSTYRGAQDEGYAAILIRGALASPSHENIRFVECISDVVSVSNLKYLLAEGPSPVLNHNQKTYSEAQ